MCGYEVRKPCEVSPSVTSDGTASVSTEEAVYNAVILFYCTLEQVCKDGDTNLFHVDLFCV